MHRVGRDNTIPGFHPSFNGSDNTFIFFYGEVDCRCHVARQLALDRKLDDIIEELTEKYINTIENNVRTYKKIIIGSVVPPLRRREWEDIHGPITHEFPFVGTDEERSLYTRKVNKLLREKIEKISDPRIVFFDFYDHYAREDGTLKYELSDGICHIKENGYVLEKLIKVINE